MGVDHKGVATCPHCGAQIRLFSIFNRSMQGLANSWKKKHQRACKDRTPAQRHAWARPYLAKGPDECSILVNPDHPGMQVKEPTEAREASAEGGVGCAGLKGNSDA
jgi:hypothetical protein